MPVTEKRISREHMYFEIAKVVAQRATCKKLKVGAVLVKDRRIVAIGYCGAPAGMPHCLDEGCLEVEGHCIRTLHAEPSIISFCAKHGISTQGAELYVTHQPCFQCLKLLVGAGILHVHYLYLYRELEDHMLVQNLIRDSGLKLLLGNSPVKKDKSNVEPVISPSMEFPEKGEE